MTAIDIAADRMLLQLRQYQDRLRLALTTCLDRPDAGYGSARAYLDDVTERARQDFDNWMVTEAHQDTGAAMIAGIAAAHTRLAQKAGAELESLLLESVSTTITALRMVAERDRDTVRRTWHRYALETRLVTMRHGTQSPMITRKRLLDRLQLRQPDRRGHMWDSGVYARAVYRQHLVESTVESTLYTMAKAGRDIAVAKWGPADNKHDFVFSISGRSERWPGYLEVKDALFHPNTTASVEPR